MEDQAVSTPPQVPGSGGVDRGPRPFISGQVIFGLAVIVLGILLLLDNMEILEAREFTRYWPVVLIAFGLLRLLQPVNPGSRVWGAIIALIGTVLLLRTIGMTQLGFRDLWPVILLLVGGSLIWGSVTRGRSAVRRDPTAEPESYIAGSAILGGFSRASNSKDFRGGDLTAIMGGCEIDLRLADIRGEEAVINTFAFWGGIEIKVPQSWSVSVRGVPILGGFSDETLRPAQPGAKRLVLTGTAIMGGVEVKN